MSTPADKAKLNHIERFANDAMDTYGLTTIGWSFKWDRAKRRFGCCDYTNKIISISRHLALLNAIDQSTDTVLHEIAHAIAGRKAGHGPKWVNACHMVGARPERCFNTSEVQTPHAKYIRYCPNCLHARPMHRKSRKRYACGTCCKKYNNGRYSEAFVLKTVNRIQYESLNPSRK